MTKDFFIKTFDEDIKEKLIENGFVYMGNEGDLACFINKPGVMTFSENDHEKIIFSNILCI